MHFFVVVVFKSSTPGGSDEFKKTPQRFEPGFWPEESPAKEDCELFIPGPLRGRKILGRVALGRVSQSCQIIAAAFSSHLTESEGNPCRPRLYNPSPTPSCWLSARSGVGDGVEGPPSCSPSFCRKNQVHAGSGAAPSRSRVPPPPERPRLAPERPRVRPQRLGPGTAGGRVGNTASQAGAVGDPSTPSPPGKQVSH